MIFHPSRSLGAGITFASLNLGSLLNAKSFPWLLQGLEFYGTFYFYSMVNILILVVGSMTIKRSDGLSLVRAEEVYEAKSKRHKKELSGSSD